MYAYIEGRPATLDPTHAVVDAGGVGYLIRIPVSTFETLKAAGAEKVRLYTHLHVTEDAHTLFGFATEEDKVIFQTLISVSGVGPGTALVALSQMKGREVANAILTGNTAVLTRIKGLGAKTAQRLVLDLQDKMLKVLNQDLSSLPQLAGGPAPTHTNRDEALNALITLGIAKATAEKTLDQIIKTDGPDLAIEDLIRRALRR